jgi:DNA-binding transcriptional LysR family regulator
MSTIKLERLKHLAIFAKVVQLGSFAAVAKQLNSSRSRISEQVAQLEEEMNVRLLQRTTRKLSLTPEGQAVFEEAVKLGAVLDNVNAQIDQTEPKGRVTITTTNDIGNNQLLGALKSFQLTYPDIDVDVILSDEKLDLIDKGIDLGIRVSLPQDRRLSGQIIHQDRFKLFASQDYLRENTQVKSLGDLQKFTWITLEQAALNRMQRFYVGDELMEFSPTKYLRCNSPLMMQAMVAEGMGIGFLLPATMKDDIQAGRVVSIFDEISGPHVVISLVYPSARQMPLRVRLLRDHLVKQQIF